MTYIGKLKENFGWNAEQESTKLAASKKPVVLKQYSGDISVSKEKQDSIKNPTVPRMG